jgi:DNA (cytosine-5)-methyltransferase 1
LPEPASPTCIELCSGAGGQALGLEQAGFRHVLLAEIDADACATLRANRPAWPVLHADVRSLASDGLPPLARGGPVDLLAAGCPARRSPSPASGSAPARWTLVASHLASTSW